LKKKNTIFWFEKKVEVYYLILIFSTFTKRFIKILALHIQAILPWTSAARGGGQGGMPLLDFHTWYRKCVFHQAVILWKYPYSSQPTELDDFCNFSI